MGFTDFIRERRFLNNVSASTISWHTHSFKWLPNESPSQADLKDAVLLMREKGLKATGCNAAIRAINAYLHWSSAGGERKCSPGWQHPHIPQLKRLSPFCPRSQRRRSRELGTGSRNRQNFYQRRLHLLPYCC